MKRLIIAVAVAGMLTGCYRMINSAVNTASRNVGESVGRAVSDPISRSIERSVERQLTPMLSSWYIHSMFAMAFGGGGYAVTESEYEAGQWTRWEGVGDSQEGWMERAYLGPDDNGNQWWRVKFYDPSDEATFVLEGLFAEEQGELRRLRRLFPGDTGPVEVPVDRESYYSPPRQLSEESLEGGKVGTVQMTVPAGTFTTDHIRFGEGGGGTWEWWINSTVPGGVVRYAQRGHGSSSEGEGEGEGEGLDPHDYDVRLLAFGAGAVSELGVR